MRNAPSAKTEIESLESRLLLSASISDLKAGPMSNTAGSLVSLYQNYSKYKSSGADVSQYHPIYQNTLLFKQNKSVAVTVKAGKGGVTALTAALKKLGANVLVSSGKYGVVDALVPIGQLHSLAVTSSVSSVNALYSAIHDSEGTSNNQADSVENADKARSLFGLDGTGIKVGVLSDSVNDVGGGLSDSQGTGDLPSDVQVISDAPSYTTPTDEGRAMLELIHDIAPNAKLAFAYDGASQLQMAQNIRQLRNAGCDVIVDDLTFLAEPMFQPGVIDQAIHDVVASGAVYLSAAGNFAQAGYESTANYAKVGSTEYIDFNSGAAVSTRLTTTITGSGTVPVVFEYNEPYNGETGSATTDLDIYVYDHAHPTRLLSSGTTNNIKTGTPIELVLVPANRQVDIVIKVAKKTVGTAFPTAFKFVGIGGDAITTPFPANERSLYGHNGGVDTVSVGAVPFYSAPPYATGTADIPSEDFSSIGPQTYYFDANGNKLSTPLVLNKPDISAVDGSNTSFFDGQNIFADDLPTQGDSTRDPDVLPNFFGTSAAAPNAAAVVALMLQANPHATQAQIVSALQATATPLNGTTAGTYDTQGGSGLINALAAVEQFVTSPTVDIVNVSPDPRATAVSQVKIIFSQQVSGFDISDLSLSLDGGPNLLSGAQRLRTADGGRTYFLSNLANVTNDAGLYVLQVTAGSQSAIVNATGIPLRASASDTFENIGPQDPPNSATNLVAKPLTSTSIQLTFQDNSTNETNFYIDRADNKSFTSNLKTFKVGPDETTFVDTTVPAGQTVYYRVRTFNTFSGFSSAATNTVTTASLSTNEIILDNDSTSGVKITGSWATKSDVSGALNTTFLDDNDNHKGEKSVTYTPNFAKEGDYYVYARYSRSGNRATNVPYTIHSASGTKTVKVDQRNTGGGGYVLLGKFHFDKGTGGYVLISNDGTTGHVIADAVRFLYAGNS